MPRPDHAMPVTPPGAGPVVGWDVGGAHLKAALWAGGRWQGARQWPCPLWQGLEHLHAALDAALAWLAPQADGEVGSWTHAVTMTGEMTDLFPDRAHGVATLARTLGARLGPRTTFYAARAGWLDADGAAMHWADVASANWHATAQAVAAALADTGGPAARAGALLVDIGSTTTDLIALAGGRVASTSASDADRLASGELVYLGLVRTPLMALATRVPWRGAPCNVMNEFFATTADVFRLLGELDPAHDQHPSADQGPKTEAATCQRLARMIGRDAADGSGAEWRALAGVWRAALLERLRENAERVCTAAGLAADAPVVVAGCGAALGAALARSMQRENLGLAQSLGLVAAGTAAPGWAAVCAPAVAVALLQARAAAARPAGRQEGMACGS